MKIESANQHNQVHDIQRRDKDSHRNDAGNAAAGECNNDRRNIHEYAEERFSLCGTVIALQRLRYHNQVMLRLRQRKADCTDLERQRCRFARGIGQIEQPLHQPIGTEKNEECANEAEQAVEGSAEPEGFGKAFAIARCMIFGEIFDGAGTHVDVQYGEIADH